MTSRWRFGLDLDRRGAQTRREQVEVPDDLVCFLMMQYITRLQVRRLCFADRRSRLWPPSIKALHAMAPDSASRILMNLPAGHHDQRRSLSATAACFSLTGSSEFAF
jgi:hypothetical protein